MRTVKIVAAVVAIALTLAGCGAPPDALQASAPGTRGAASMPPGFLWGVSTAGYQYEGGNFTSQWYPFEQAGRTSERCGQAADGWNRYADDMDLAKGLGCSGWRTSIEWSRIEPAPGQFDQAAIAHYHQMIAKMIADGMTPVITLMHMSYPAWLDDEGGWEGPNVVDEYSHYVAFVAQEFGGQVKTFLTINEPTTFVLGHYLMGLNAPGYHNPIRAHAVMNNVVACHRRAYAILHQMVPGVRVSCNEYIADYRIPFNVPLPDFAEDWFLDQVSGNPKTGVPASEDFLALDYYCRTNLTPGTQFNHGWTWPVDPTGFRDALEHYWARYHLPILVAENGMASDDGAPRADGWTREAYLTAHVKAMQDAQATGVPLLGYFVWSITDNWEWGSFSPRFGLYRVECRTGDYTRYPTPSADAYRQIVAAGGVTPAIQAEFPAPGASASVVARR